MTCSRSLEKQVHFGKCIRTISCDAHSLYWTATWLSMRKHTPVFLMNQWLKNNKGTTNSHALMCQLHWRGPLPHASVTLTELGTPPLPVCCVHGNDQCWGWVLPQPWRWQHAQMQSGLKQGFDRFWHGKGGIPGVLEK